ncbi:MAG: hypothetical protein ABSF10_19555 [Verrucomicrobiota bacterium]|jgi:hypothetical protein
MKVAKIFFLAVLVATTGIIGLVGCKPKATTVSGQVFIVTKGAENFKLGDVEILLVEKSQVTDFLQKKQPAIDLEMASKRQELTNAEQQVATALGKADKAQAYFDWFTANKSYKTNTEYIKASSEWDNLFKQYVRQTNYVARLVQNTNYDENTINTLKAAVKKRKEMVEQLNSLSDQKKAIKTAAIASETEKIEVVKSSVTEANSHVATVKTNLENSPTVADYLEDFLPVVVQKTLSDSDGKFSFTYPRDKMLAIFAHAQRMVLDKTETYYWLVDAPTNAETTQIFLSNNNLVFADPDGYFKIKPKEEKQGTTAP